MLGIVAKNAGGTEVLELNEVPTPQPDKNEVLEKAYSASINPVDYKIREPGMNRSMHSQNQ
jgi:NADPH2:quinone reductase